MNSTLSKFAILVLAATAASSLQAQQRTSASRDAYGYSSYDSPRAGYCNFDYVSLDSVGSSLTLVPGRPGAAVDDRAALLPLAKTFELYALPADSLVVSGNGYIALADSFAQEDGSDFSNDCPLPAIADNPASRQERIYVYHDDLRPQAGGQVRQAHFATCPRASETGATEACTVIEWDGFERVAATTSVSPLRAQAVLYHGSHQVVMQYDSVDDSQGTQATIGIQGFEAGTARAAGCNAPARVVAKRSICFFDPRHRQGTVAPGTVLD